MVNPDCIFCDIYRGREPAKVLHKDEQVIIFSDIRPAAKHHYLIVPKEHISSAKQLRKEHIPLVETLAKHGERILLEQEADIRNSRCGFHWPPFNSISHLHLHVISPASEMSCFSKIIFQENNLWFVKCFEILAKICPAKTGQTVILSSTGTYGGRLHWEFNHHLKTYHSNNCTILEWGLDKEFMNFKS